MKESDIDRIINEEKGVKLSRDLSNDILSGISESSHSSYHTTKWIRTTGLIILLCLSGLIGHLTTDQVTPRQKETQLYLYDVNLEPIESSILMD